MFYVIAFCLVLIIFFLENLWIKHCRLKFLHVIHVNGIRGKTTVCRLLDTMLRERYRVFTKTTGTDPQIIGVDGVQRPIRRRGCANIREQLRIICRAYKENAEILIVECMAVKPLLQSVSAHDMLSADIGIITNVRYDHILEMGDTLDEIAKSLCNTIPKNGYIFSGMHDHTFQIMQRSLKNGSVFIPVCGCEEEGESENYAIASSVARFLGLSKQQIDSGVSKLIQDFGTSMEYKVTTYGGYSIRFLNLFSVNDPQSTMMHLRFANASNTFFLYNDRVDRPDRLVLFARKFFPNWQDATVFLVGQHNFYAERELRKVNGLKIVRVRCWRECLSLPEGSLLVGIGNIKGAGYEMIMELNSRREESTI